MKCESDQAAIDSLVRRFFAAFDNRNGRTPLQDRMTELFAPGAVIAKHHDGTCELYTSEEFAKPRVALLTNGELGEFHEWEETSSTEIVGSMATRTCRYGKYGLLEGAAYSGTGTKFFQLAKVASNWRILALSWIDDIA